jgi:hypothetical protein
VRKTPCLACYHTWDSWVESVFPKRRCRTQRIAVSSNGNADASASTEGFHPKYDDADTNMNVP